MVPYKVQSGGKRIDLPVKGEGRTYGKKTRRADRPVEHLARGRQWTPLRGLLQRDASFMRWTMPPSCSAGRVGVWTKADSVTQFDDLTVGMQMSHAARCALPRRSDCSSCVAMLFSAACRQPEPGADEPRRSRSTCQRIGCSPNRCCSEYERRSGVTVNAVYDTEETKSTGLANRLIAEQSRPQADVFWSNEPVRTLVLKSRAVLAPYRSPNAEGIPAALIDPEGYWTGFSARMRVIAYNTNLVKTDEAPQSVLRPR